MKKTLFYLNGIILSSVIFLLSCSKKESAFFTNHYPTGYTSLNSPNKESIKPEIQNHIATANKEIVAAVGEQVIFKPEIGVSNNNSDEIKAILSDESQALGKDVSTTPSKKEIKKIVKKAIKESKSNDSNVSKLLLVIIAILIPPLAVALVDGIHGPFWLSILLTILFYIPGLIYAIYRIYKND
ncbi:MAG: YqaE/Pmp3 family membrane protein [Sporocytophaga sp.]|nr:YqaE/Pmp3 family membrane protein [Sporocytophaga sp.]MBO9701727.1 YqaE/Pmp3 family membrane protein [Sporocytophaga sp.]